MPLEKKPFIRYRLDKEREKDKYRKLESRMSRADDAKLETFKQAIQQPKDSTALKQALDLALSFVMDDRPMTTYREILLGNRRRNKRIGVVDFE